MGRGLAELHALLPTTVAGVQDPVAEKPGKTFKTKEEKFKALEQVAKDLNKQFGTTQSIVRMDRKKLPVLMPSIKTGIYTFDFDIVGTGGVPRGRVIEIFGPESSGKTTLATIIVAAEQNTTENLAAYIDAEHALDLKYMAKLGVKIDELLVSQPDNGEEALETADALIDSGTVSLIVIDSVAALVPKAELDGDMGDSHMGLQARLMSQALRKLTGKAAKAGVTIIFINQIREKIGVMFGNPETTTGGRALKFWASLRLDTRKTGVIKSGDVVIGHKLKIKGAKNKVGTPFVESEFDLIYGKGIDRDKDFVEYAIRVGAIQQAGAWYSFEKEKIGQGLTNVVARVTVEPELQARIEAEVAKAQAAQREADEQ